MPTEQSQQNQTRTFKGLNYSLGNEDCSLETVLIPKGAKHIASVAIGGTQLVPFLCRGPQSITFVDVSGAQLTFLWLRLSMLSSCSFEDYAKHLGYSPYADGQKLKPLIYSGRWEKRVQKLSLLYRLILGSKARGIFECTSFVEQQAFMHAHFPHYRYRLLCRIMASLAAGVAKLRPDEVPPFVKAADFYSAYTRIFNELVYNTFARENFFLQLMWLGKIAYPCANPFEAQREFYEVAQAWRPHCDVQIEHGDLIDVLTKQTRTYDFVALSNISSYFKGERASDFLQQLRPVMNPGGRIVVRNFLRKLDRLVCSGFRDVTRDHRKVIDNECTRVYDVTVFEKVS